MNFKYTMRIFAGHQIIQKKMTADEATEFENDLKKKSDGWITLADNEGRVHTVRYSAITGIERAEPVKPAKKDYVTIAELARVFGVSTRTVTRNVKSLKDMSSESSERTNRRATKGAAFELRKHLLNSDFHDKPVPSEEEIAELFAPAKQSRISEADRRRFREGKTVKLKKRIPKYGDKPTKE